SHYTDLPCDYTDTTSHTFKNLSDELEAPHGKVTAWRYNNCSRRIFIKNLGQHLGRFIFNISGGIYVNVIHLLSSARQSSSSGNRKIFVFPREYRLFNLPMDCRNNLSAHRHLVGNFIRIFGFDRISFCMEFFGWKNSET
ncbi:MAG: hypothetical protein AAB953_03775, partial [Patescibacteria group bacterium]